MQIAAKKTSRNCVAWGWNRTLPLFQGLDVFGWICQETIHSPAPSHSLQPDSLPPHIKCQESHLPSTPCALQIFYLVFLFSAPPNQLKTPKRALMSFLCPAPRHSGFKRWIFKRKFSSISKQSSSVRTHWMYQEKVHIKKILRPKTLVFGQIPPASGDPRISLWPAYELLNSAVHHFPQRLPRMAGLGDHRALNPRWTY